MDPQAATTNQPHRFSICPSAHKVLTHNQESRKTESAYTLQSYITANHSFPTHISMAQAPVPSPDQRTSPSRHTCPRRPDPPMLVLKSRVEALSRRLLHELTMIALTRRMERLQLSDTPPCCEPLQEEITRTPIPDTPVTTTKGLASTATGAPDPSPVMTTTISGILLDIGQNGARIVPSSRRANGTIRPEIKIRPGYIPPEDARVYSVRNIPRIKNLIKP